MRRFLLIDTATEPCTVGVATARKVLAEASIPDRHQLSEALLRQIDELTGTAEVTLSELAAVGVVSGPGPFTALRIGAAVANAIAYAHGLPMVAVSTDEAPSVATFASLVSERLEGRETVKAVLPNYGREPSITIPESGRR